MTIDELANNLQNWRKNKKSHRDKIPEEYWEAAIALAKKYSHTKIARQVGLSTSDLKRKMGKSVVFKKKKSPVQFKEIKISPRSSTPIFELMTAQGSIVRVYQ